MPKKAILFGAIGTIVETSDIQRQYFNAAFDEAGLDWNWSPEEYRQLLLRPGGRRRIEEYAASRGEEVNADALYSRKSQLFQDKLSAGVETRPGVLKVIAAAKAQNVAVGFVTTTSPQNVSAVLRATKGALRRSDFDFLGHDDLVMNGKPAPDIYQFALESLGVTAKEAIAIEDTPASAKSSLAAGIPTLAFKGKYASDDFDQGTQQVVELTEALVGLVPPELPLAS